MKVKKISHSNYKENIQLKVDFRGTTVYSGIDVHKKSWSVGVMIDDNLYKSFSQIPDSNQFVRYLRNNFPNADRYICAYEAGFCGYHIAEEINSYEGFSCIVVNPADVPTKDKERQNRNDRVDARKIARELSKGNLESIYLPSTEDQIARGLLRLRKQIVKKHTRCKVQIKSLLDFTGISTPEGIEDKHWSKRYIEYLRNLKFQSEIWEFTMKTLLDELTGQRENLLRINKEIRKLSSTEKYKEDVNNLISLSGIQTLSAMTILTEIMDINRFRGLDSLSKYVGLVPSEDSSGEKESKGRINKRKNKHLRELLIEISWVAIRKDRTLMSLYKGYLRRMAKNKAIIKIARHMLGRIRFVLKNKKTCLLGEEEEQQAA